MEKKELKLTVGRMKMQLEDGEANGKIETSFEEITEEHAFEIMKLYVGQESHKYNFIKKDDITFVKPGIGCPYSCKYVYNYGLNLLQVLFMKYDEKNTYFEVKIME